jgi:hypothetical protein
VGSQKGSGNVMSVKTILFIYLLFPLSPKIITYYYYYYYYY